MPSVNECIGWNKRYTLLCPFDAAICWQFEKFQILLRSTRLLVTSPSANTQENCTSTKHFIPKAHFGIIYGDMDMIWRWWNAYACSDKWLYIFIYVSHRRNIATTPSIFYVQFQCLPFVFIGSNNINFVVVARRNPTNRMIRYFNKDRSSESYLTDPKIIKW